MQGKVLARRHDDALQDAAANAPGRYNPLPVLLARRLKQVEADLEFLKELRMQIDTTLCAPLPEEAELSEPIAPKRPARRRPGVSSR